MMHTVLAVLGWVLLSLLALLLVLLVTPAGVALELRDDTFTVRLRLLCFSFLLWPAREKPPRKKAAPPPAPAKEQAKAKEKKKGAPLTLGQAADLVSAAGWGMRLVLRCLHVRGVTAVWPVHREDAAETAIAFGKTQAYLGTALGALQNCLDIRLKKVDIIPDFTGEYKYRRYFYCKIQAVPFIMIIAAVYALVRLKADRVI